MLGWAYMKADWKSFSQATKDQPPRPLLVLAMGYVNEREQALDLGAGALNDSRYLLEQGFSHVTAVDQELVSTEIAKTISQDQFSYIASSFDEFSFPRESYDLINAQYALPFNGTETFTHMFNKLKASLKPGGVFVGQLFGKNDTWNKGDKQMTFHDIDEVEDLLADMEVIQLEEREFTGTTVSGEQKHWHVYNIIARKR